MPRYQKNNIVKLHNIFRPQPEEVFRYRFNISGAAERRLRFLMFKWGCSPSEVFERCVQISQTIYQNEKGEKNGQKSEQNEEVASRKDGKTRSVVAVGPVQSITSIVTGLSVSSE
jgi:hypothetical protein